jgi:hypothetical protein
MTLTRQCGWGGKGGFAAFTSPLMTAKAVISSASEKSLFERNQRFKVLALFYHNENNVRLHTHKQNTINTLCWCDK